MHLVLGDMRDTQVNLRAGASFVFFSYNQRISMCLITGY